MNRHSSLLPSVLLGVISLMITAFSATTDAAVGKPPPEYRLADVRITVTRQPGNPSFNRRSISISGDGQCEQTDTKPAASSKRCGSLDRKAVLELVNEFYRVRFFDLSDSYRVRYRVFVLDNGIVRRSVLRMVDTGSVQLCFEVSDYRKCITFILDVPKDIEGLAQRILSLAD